MQKTLLGLLASLVVLGCSEPGPLPPCVPTTCAAQGKDCGTIPDGCGEALSCGTCVAPESCGAAGVENLCGQGVPCTPPTEAELCTLSGTQCGSITILDACGDMRTAQCGPCPNGQLCGLQAPNVCSEPPCTGETDAALCAGLHKNCGALTVSDSCEVTRNIECGSCVPPQTCGGGGQENVCGEPGPCVPESDQAFCQRLAKNCGQVVATDNCGAPRASACGMCAEPASCGGDGTASVCGTAYPYRDVWDIKGIQPDNWSRDELVANGVGNVAVNLVWALWQPSEKAPPCGGSEFEYENRCFAKRPTDDTIVKAWSDRGIRVTGILYGVPLWARANRNSRCSPHAPGFEWFCAPDEGRAVDYGRFTAMLADRFDGTHGLGHIADFVIHNEVNVNAWFDVGCGGAVPCNTQEWLDTYAASYLAAYDAIKREQPAARVLMSLDHHFDERHDQPADPALARLSAKALIKGVAAKAGAREWQVAFHPYPPHLDRAEFDASDLREHGKVSFGSIGALPGWLRATFPDDPHAWEVQLTESGVTSGDAGNAAAATAQANKLCDSFRNILGTPGLTNHIYHRMVDHPDEGILLRAWPGATAPASRPGTSGRPPTSRAASAAGSRNSPTPACARATPAPPTSTRSTGPPRACCPRGSARSAGASGVSCASGSPAPGCSTSAPTARRRTSSRSTPAAPA